MNHETEEHFKKSWRDTWYPQTKTVHIQACDVPVTFVSRSTSFGGIKWQISVTEDNYKLHFYVHGVGGEIFMTQMLQIKHVCTHTALKKCDLLLRVYVKLCFGASTCSSVSYFLIEKKKNFYSMVCLTGGFFMTPAALADWSERPVTFKTCWWKESLM